MRFQFYRYLQDYDDDNDEPLFRVLILLFHEGFHARQKLFEPHFLNLQEFCKEQYLYVTKFKNVTKSIKCNTAF